MSLSVVSRVVSSAGGRLHHVVHLTELQRLTFPRGLAGTILVYKLAAALAEQGADLDKVEAVAKYATTRLGTLGIGLDHCHVCLRLHSHDAEH
jgi:dihydroxyacetone kinase